MASSRSNSTLPYSDEAFELASDTFSDQPSTSSSEPPTQAQENTFLGRLARSAFPETVKLASNLTTQSTTLTKTALELSSEVSDTCHKVSAAATTFSSLAANLTSTSSEVTAFINTVRTIVTQTKDLSNYVDKICDAVALLVDIIIAWAKKIYASIPTLLWRLFSLFGMTTPLIQIAMLKLGRFFLPTEPNQAENIAMTPQSNVPFSGLPHILVECVGMFFMKRCPTDSELKSVTERLRFNEIFSRTVSSTMDSLLAFIRSLPEICKEWAHQILPLQWWLNIFAPGSAYYQWLNDVESLHCRTVEEALTYDQLTQDRVRKLHATGLQMIQELSSRGPEFTKVFQLLRDKMKFLDDLFEQVDASGTTRNARPVPFVIYLSGLPGQGKSFLTGVLPAILAGCSPDTPNIAWSRNAGVAHWDGYTGQFAVIYDDFDATRSVNVSPGEHAELMSIVSNEQYRLPMASLDQKGEVFRSKVVMISSNSAFPRPNTLNHQEALWRRRHAMYEIGIHPQFRKRGSNEVNPALIPADNSHYRIRRFLNPVKEDTALTPFMTYQEFIDDVRRSYAEHQREQVRALVASRAMIAAEVNRVVMQPQGLLTDTINRLERDMEFVKSIASSFADNFRNRLTEFFSDPVPPWMKAVLVGASLLAGTFALWDLGKTLFSSEANNTINVAAEQVVFYVVQDYYDTAQYLPESNRDQKLHMVRTALRAFEKLLTEEELDTIVQKYVPEGAYHGVKNMPPRPRLMRLEGKEQSKTSFLRRQARKAALQPEVMKPEGQSDSNAMSIVDNRIYPNLVTVAREGNSMHALFIAGRVMLLPRHFFHDYRGAPIQPGAIFHVLWYEAVFMESYDPTRRVDINGDSVLYECSPNVPGFADITKHFIKDSDLSSKSEFRALLCMFSQALPFIQSIDIARNTKPVDVPFDARIEYSSEERGNIIQYHQGWTYQAETSPGSCGSPLVVLDTSMARKVVGIHVAATPAKNYAAAMLVTQEMLEKGLARFGRILKNSGMLPPGVIESDEGIMCPQGNFSLIGKLAKRVHVPATTKIRPSIIHAKLFVPTTAPAVLTPRDPRLEVSIHPLKAGVEKYGNVAPLFDMTILQKVSKHMNLIFKQWTHEMPKEVVSEFVSINGHPGYSGFEPLPMDTSPGYPLNQLKKAPGEVGKSFLFSGEPGKREVSSTELRQMIDLRLAFAKKGLRSKSLWLDCLKDERRPLAKIAQGKTRVFTIPPVDYTIAFRMYCGAFTTSFIQNHQCFFSAVGMDPESSDWTQLMRRMQEYSDTGFAGDYSGWDGNISPIVIMEVCEIINRWYNDSEENQLVRRVLFDEIAHTPQAFLSTVYMTHIGNPSGTPMTAILNTIVNAMYIRYCWLRLAPATYASLSEFEKNVRDKELGDDNILSVRQQVRHFFNPDSLGDELAKINMTYTAATKDGKAQWLPLEQLTFLKRSFRLGERSLWLPLMDKNTIQELTNWVRESDFMTPREMTLSNCNEALRFAFFYGHDYFDDLYARLCEALPKDAMYLLDWDFLYNWFYGKEQSNVMYKHRDLRYLTLDDF